MASSSPESMRAFYDAEAERYDETRGGERRAALAAAAFADLIGPPGQSSLPVLEVGTGTAIVAGALGDLGYRVVGADLSAGMLRWGAERRPVALLQADGRALPLADGCCAAVVLSWVLHLVADPAPLVAEAARVLAPAGALVSTVDKSASSRAVGGPTGPDRAVTDAPVLLDALAQQAGLVPAGTGSYVAHGQRGAPTYQLRAWARPARPPG